MQPEQQQRILGYFIEEARDHLNTIEQGLLNLQSTLQDSEMVNEIFRAAHSIKGGAAMLGLNSIQRTSHRLEDFFKVLKECQSVQIDQTIESLFLRMFDNLQALLDQLQSESGLSEDVANQLMSEVEPVFAALEKHLELRVNQAGGTMQLEETYEAAPTLKQPPATTSPVPVFQNSVPEILRQMLQLFKQPETTQTRQQLEQLCNELAELGEQFNLSGWYTLCQTAAGAIADNDNSYRTLAPIVIKEIKLAQELVLTDRADEIATCEKLQALSLKTFLSDCEDTSTSIESEDKLAPMMVVDQQQSTDLFSINHNVVESELLTDIAQLSTQEQVADWVAEDNLSSLFALNSNNNNQTQDSATSESINIENDLESSPNKLSKHNLPLISSEETSALNSLFDEAQDTSLDLTTAEPAFCDLFKAPEADVESLDLLEISTATSTENSDLSSLWTSPDVPTGSELDKEEFSFPLGADDLFADSEELFTLPVLPSEANNDVDDNIDFALSNSSEPEQKLDDHWFVDPQSDLSTVLECTLSSDSNEILNAAVDATPAPTPTPEITTDLESSLTASVSNLFSSVIAETDSNLELFESPTQTGEQLDFSLESSSTDLFNTLETDSNLELFESTAQTTDQLDFSLDVSSTDLFSSAETDSNLELFESPAQTGDELDFSLDSSTDLFNTLETNSNLELFESTAQTTDQLDFSLDVSSTDLFSSAETDSNLELFESPAQTGDELDFSLDSSTDLFSSAKQSSLELFESTAQTGDELNLSLESSSTDSFNTIETDSNLELFESPTLTSEQLDFSLESSSTDLFSSGEQPIGELFESTAQTGEQLDFSLDSSTDLFNTLETDSNLELFESTAQTGDELNLSLESSSTDLFNTLETDSNLELFESTAQTGDELNLSLESSSTDLFNTLETDSNLELFESTAQTGDELDLNLDSSTDLFSSAETDSNLELFESTAQTGEQLDLSLDSSTDLFNTLETDSNLELFESTAQTGEQLDFSLESSSTDLFNTLETDSNLELFESTAQTGEQLDFSLESSSTDLFNTLETDSNLELFESTAQTGDELNLSLESSSTDLFNTLETDSNLELFESTAQTGDELDLNLDSSTDLFSSGEQPSLELFESTAQTGEQLDLSLDSSTDLFSSAETDSNLELFESTAQTGEQLDLSLDSSTDLFSSAETDSNLELFESTAQTGEQLDLSLDSSTDLFSSAKTDSNLELFESTAQTGEQLDLSLDSSTDLFSSAETDSNLELFESTAQTGEQLDLSLDSSTDLFSSGEQPIGELFESPPQTGEQLDLSLDSSTDLFNTLETDSNFELFESTAQTGDELDFSLDATSTDLFNTLETDSNFELFESTAQTGDELDLNLDSSTDLFSSAEQSSLELFESPTQTGDELDFSLEYSSTDLFSSAEDDSNLELFVAPTENTSQLDFSLETSNTDLFGSTQIDSNLELDQPADTPGVENSADLMAFELINSTEMTLEDESNNRVEMGVEEMPSQHEDSAASVVSDVEVEGELSTAIATESVVDDFAELEALLEEESTSNVVAAAQALFDLNSPIAPVTTAAPQSSNDEFDDLEMLLQETPTTPATPEPVKPQKPAQKPATTNSRRSVFEQMMRVPVKQLDSISNQVGELVVYRNSLEQDQERLRQFLDNLLHQVQQLGDVGSRMQELYERSLVEASLLTSRTGSHSTSIDPTPASKGHVTGINFDALEMDRFTGFHTLAQEMIELIVRVREASSDIEFVTGETEQVARQFRQVTTQLQEGITRSRMVPFSQIAERLPRAVRDISLKYGKQAELVIEGKDTLIDKVILEQLYDPMTHLVNNAITHGIESSQERSKNGKSPVGQITIRAFHQGNQTVITVSDDGAGIDPERVKAKAIKNGLITPEAANNMSRLDVYNLLFHAGFSTKDAVDEFAGRGVGMDVVLTSLSQIRGTITTDSTLGKGTTFTIRLPLTLSICKALCCLSDKARVAFPMDGVEQMIDIPQESVITNAQGQTCIPWHDSLLPFRHLREFLSFNRQISRGNIYGSSRDDNMISVIVLRSADMFFAIQVDQVLGEQEIVIKQFEGPAPKPVGIAGATILGDGRIMPIADVLELIDLSMGRIRQQGEGTWWTPNDPSLPPETTSTTRTEPMVLIVDDSITVRELLSMTFVNAGYRVEQARDGQEAWDKLRDGLPCDLIFCDIEMPKMDGLELLSRKQQDPKLCQLPIAMLTSRGSDRHRQMALQLGASGYFTKPYLEEALLDGAQRMLKGEVLITPSASSV